MSFFGGGTDFPEYYRQHGGQVLSTTFNKYCYISCRRLPPFFEHRHRIVHSVVENVINVSEIKHPAVRAILSDYEKGFGFEIHHDGDLPARSGLGSSSSFVVGLVNALRGMEGKISSKSYLANEALRYEQDVLAETVGSQDQIAAAYGGFNNIVFNLDGSHSVNPLITGVDRLSRLNDNLILFFTGLTRFSSEIAKEQKNNTSQNTTSLSEMSDQVDYAMNILANDQVSLDEFGMLMDQAWVLKKSLSGHVSTAFIDDVYETAIKAGAIGGKVLGAGGGGFMLFYAKQQYHKKISDMLKPLIRIPFRFESSGSSIVLYVPEEYNE